MRMTVKFIENYIFLIYTLQIIINKYNENWELLFDRFQFLKMSSLMAEIIKKQFFKTKLL